MGPSNAVVARRFAAGAVLVAVLATVALILVQRPHEPQNRPSAPHAPAEPRENLTERAKMMQHARGVWPKVQEQYRTMYPDDMAYVPRESVQSSKLGSPTVVWLFDSSLPATASPWLGLEGYADRIEYVIPLTVDGHAVGSLMSYNLRGRWRVWPERDWSVKAEESLPALSKHFGTDDFEWVYVFDGGMWVLARTGGRVAGVYIDPVFDHRADDPPTGVLSGERLRFYLDHPLGRTDL